MRWSIPLLLLAGCAPVTAIGDKIIGLTNPVLVGGLVIGTRLPDDEGLRQALASQGLEESTFVQLAVADALELRDMENALITDAVVTLETPDAFDIPLGADDWYQLPAGPVFAPGETWTLSAEMSDRVGLGTVEVPLPESADLQVDAIHDTATDLVIDLGGPYDFAFAAVYDHTGTETWTNAPTTSEEIVNLVLPLSDPIEQLVVPAEAFGEGSLYAVGVAGLRRAPFENIDGLNEALTAVLAGELELFPVVDRTPVGVGALLLDVPTPPAPFDQGFALESRVEIYTFDLLDGAAGIPGADVRLDDQPMAPEHPTGRYRLEGIDLTPGTTVDITVGTDRSELTGRFQPTLPEPPVLTVPTDHPAGDDLTLAFPAGPWADALTVVIGADGLTFSSIPEDGDAIRATLAAPSPDGVTGVTIPAGAFGSPGLYVVGVAPLADLGATMADVNTTVSHGLVGSLQFHPVTVVP